MGIVPIATNSTMNRIFCLTLEAVGDARAGIALQRCTIEDVVAPHFTLAARGVAVAAQVEPTGATHQVKALKAASAYSRLVVQTSEAGQLAVQHA